MTWSKLFSNTIIANTEKDDLKNTDDTKSKQFKKNGLNGSTHSDKTRPSEDDKNILKNKVKQD